MNINNSISQQNNSVVLDLGACSARAGFGGEKCPRTLHPSIYGYPKSSRIMTGAEQILVATGSKAQKKKSVLTIESIYNDKRELVKSKGLAQFIQDILLQDLNFESSGRNILCSEKALDSINNNKILGEIVFEKHGFANFQTVPDNIMALYACGKTSGTSVSVGLTGATSMSIFDGYGIKESVMTTRRGAGIVEAELRDIIYDMYYNECLLSGEELVKPDILELRKFMKDNLQTKTETNSDGETKAYELPDGTKVSVNSNKFNDALEVLWKPEENQGPESLPLDQLILNSIKACPNELREPLYQNIVMEGGITTCEGFYERMYTELSRKDERARVYIKSDRDYLTWIGGSLMIKLAHFQQNWIGKDKYIEYGDSIFSRMSYF